MPGRRGAEFGQPGFHDHFKGVNVGVHVYLLVCQAASGLSLATGREAGD